MLGVDVSTKKIAVARVALYGADNEVIELKASGALAGDRFADLVCSFDHYIRAIRGTVAAAFIEDVPFVRNRAGTIHLAQIVGGVAAICAVHRVPVAMINNLTWKARLGVGGKNPKQKIAEYAAARFPEIQAQSQDSLDALCIGEAGRRIVGEDAVRRAEIEKVASNAS